MLPDWELDVWGEKDRFCVGVGLFYLHRKWYHLFFSNNKTFHMEDKIFKWNI